jgi:hypothetical protein
MNFGIIHGRYRPANVKGISMLPNATSYSASREMQAKQVLSLIHLHSFLGSVTAHPSLFGLPLDHISADDLLRYLHRIDAVGLFDRGPMRSDEVLLHELLLG